jgi:hypothetical protein
MKPKSIFTKINDFSFGAFLRSLNVALIRSAGLEVSSKENSAISLGEIFGHLDAFGYLILLFSLLVTLVVAFGSGILLLEIWPEALQLSYLAALPGVVVGFLTCSFLFRIKRWLAL